MALKFLGSFCELSLSDELAVMNPFRECLKSTFNVNVSILFKIIINNLPTPTFDHMKSM
jgi:hypothetical protein